MKKNKAQKDILYVSISSFVLVVFWIGFNIYHAAVTSTITPDLQLDITPIDPTFNLQAISKLKTRHTVIPVYELKNATGSSSLTPLPNTQSQAVQSIQRLGQ